jgi:hypothetical protein
MVMFSLLESSGHQSRERCLDEEGGHFRQGYEEATAKPSSKWNARIRGGGSDPAALFKSFAKIGNNL